MTVEQLLHASESYTYANWNFHNVNVRFSRLYYIIDGEAYYEENGRAVRLKKNHLYLTPVNTPFDLYENPENKLLHTYVHIITFPLVTRFTEIEVIEGTPLSDAVALWRKYVKSGNNKLITNTVQFLLSQISEQFKHNTVAEQTKQYLDFLQAPSFSMETMCNRLGYSREHITRVFSATYKTTPKQYFSMKCMNLALEKLRQGETLQSIADQLGYATSYSFSKAFKKHFGASPIKYLSESSDKDIKGAGSISKP